MMNGSEKSDSAIVAEKSANKAGMIELMKAAEQVEPRAGTKENADQQNMCRAQNRESMTSALDRIRNAAGQRKKEKFTTLLHHITPEVLREAFFAIKRKAAPGADGVTWEAFEVDLDQKIGDLHRKVQNGAYRPQPALRAYILKADGRPRPLSIASLSDKIVQRATATILNQIYEEDFLGFSYGFRPERGQHDALDALYVGITKRCVNYILDADIQSFFDNVNQEWLIRFLEHRIGDPRIIRLVRKWLRAGTLEDGVTTVGDRGTGQGASISPLLANIYLHYVLDLWAERWRRREAKGAMIIVRYADDIVVGFEYESDGRRFQTMLRERLRQFDLQLHPEKTRLIEFGRYAAHRGKKRGLSRPETFDFLGFTHISGRSRKGTFQLQRKSRRDRRVAKLRQITEVLKRHISRPIPVQGKWLKQVLTGYFAYHAVPTNSRSIHAFRHHVKGIWLRMLKRRSQRHKMTWQRMDKIAQEWLPIPRILHPWPDERFFVTHPR